MSSGYVCKMWLKDGFSCDLHPRSRATFTLINLMVDTEAPVVVMDNYSYLTGTRSNPFLACSQVIAITLWAIFVTIRILSRKFTITHLRESLTVKRRKKNWIHMSISHCCYSD